jgi:hypothetical protein
MLAFCRRFLPLLVLSVTTASCSGGFRPTLDAANTVDSSATIVIADVTYPLKVVCYEVGDDLTAVGVGTDSATGKAVKVWIHGPASAYVGLIFGDDEYIYEPDAGVALTLERDGDRLAGQGITFVRDIDLGSAQGSPVGSGSVDVVCASLRAGPPPSVPSR